MLNPWNQDQRIFLRLVSFLEKKKSSEASLRQPIPELANFFLKAPYRGGTLEKEGTEKLTVNLREFDCWTFIETVVALAWMIKSRETSFETFRKILKKIRYRQGRLQGYSSRLHYFSDWIHDNQKKSIVKEVTQEMGGRPFRKTIHFMTTHPDLYPLLKNSISLRRMRRVERAISKRTYFFIPKKTLRSSEDRIRQGDLIAITTNRVGLDVQHVGIAARVRNRIHLIHASSKEGRVVLSKKTLYRYLMDSRVRSGIMVVRIF